MQNRTMEIGVGLFLLAGILALLLLALRVSGLSPTASTDTYKLYAYFDNIAGLTVRATVTMAGVTIGKVTAVDLDRDNYTARVTLQLEKRSIPRLAGSTAAPAPGKSRRNRPSCPLCRSACRRRDSPAPV